MAKNVQPDMTLIMLLTGGFVLPQFGLQAAPWLGWLALLLPLGGWVCLLYAARRHPAQPYRRIVTWGQILAGGLFFLLAAQLLR